MPRRSSLVPRVIPVDPSLSLSLPRLSRGSLRLIVQRVCSRDTKYSRLISLQNCALLPWGGGQSAGRVLSFVCDALVGLCPVYG